MHACTHAHTQKRTNFHLTIASLIKKYYTVSIKIKTCISQILASKNIKAFQSLSKLQFLTFMTKVNPDDKNKTKSHIFNGTYSNLTSFSIGHKIQALA